MSDRSKTILNANAESLTITLRVSPSDVSKLFAAFSEGKLSEFGVLDLHLSGESPKSTKLWADVEKQPTVADQIIRGG